VVSVILNTSPARRTRWPACASLRFSLPSHRGWWDGSAINSKISSGVAAISLLALTTRGASCSSGMATS
jgi:hypothetical protein